MPTFDETFAGHKLYAIHPASVFARLGLVDGDLVTAVDGVTLDISATAYRVLGAAVESAGRFEVAFRRKGEARTLLVELVD